VHIYIHTFTQSFTLSFIHPSPHRVAHAHAHLPAAVPVCAASPAARAAPPARRAGGNRGGAAARSRRALGVPAVHARIRHLGALPQIGRGAWTGRIADDNPAAAATGRPPRVPRVQLACESERCPCCLPATVHAQLRVSLEGMQARVSSCDLNASMSLFEGPCSTPPHLLKGRKLGQWGPAIAGPSCQQKALTVWPLIDVGSCTCWTRAAQRRSWA